MYRIAVLVTLILSPLAGCGDAIFYDRQVVTLHVTDKTTGANIAHAEITASYDPPSFTDETGRTEHAFRFVSICGGPILLNLLFCNKVRGDITDSDQFIRIKTETAEDFLTITIAPNQSVAGNSYSVTVEQIAVPELDPDPPSYPDE